jgi:pyruvate,water dikinase
VESVKPIHALVRLADLVRSNPIYLKLFTHSRNSDVWQTIQTEPHFRELKTNLEKYLDAYGDRGLEELKLEVETFRERPELLVKLINDHVSLELSVEGMREKEQKIRTESEKAVLRNLRNPLKQCVFRWVLANARQAIAARENMRFSRSRAYGIVRRIFKRLGEWLTEKNMLACPSDIYYLTTDEVIGFVQGTAVTQDLQALVDLRKKEYAAFAHRNADDRIETLGIPYLGSFSSEKKENGCAKTLKGIGCSGGLARGKAKIVLDPNSVKDIRGQILVAHSTDPGWVFLMISSQGIVVEKGSVLSHTAIIGRELGIPTIVGVKDATTLTPDGETVVINGSTGVILWQ